VALDGASPRRSHCRAGGHTWHIPTPLERLKSRPRSIANEVGAAGGCLYLDGLGALYGPPHAVLRLRSCSRCCQREGLWETSAIGLLTRPTLLRYALEVSEGDRRRWTASF
jgi:hypothetical protein